MKFEHWVMFETCMPYNSHVYCSAYKSITVLSPMCQNAFIKFIVIITEYVKSHSIKIIFVNFRQS